jgi:hypothetical protein
MPGRLIVVTISMIALVVGVRGQSGSPVKDPTFRKDIAPMLKSSCAPCHFKDGQVFDRYPFDKYETVRKLGLRLNSRLKGEKADLVTRWVKAGTPE